MSDLGRLEEELRNTPEGSIVFLETTSDKALDVGLKLVKLYSDKNDKGIIVSANRPYRNLVNLLKSKDVDVSRMHILDCISKGQDADVEAENVEFVDNVSALTDISLSISENIKNSNGKKFVFFDSIPTMLIHNKPYVFARFVHSVLTKMRLNNVGGVLVSLQDDNNKEVRAEIAQLCDKVIHI